MSATPTLANLIDTSEDLVVFTGAGVSTLCGIPDFRGPRGINRQLDADRIFSGAEFRRNPAYYYRHARDFIYTLDRFEPGPVHQVCAALEANGRLRGVVTQNIDMLHRRAGSRRVIELHGTPERHECPACGTCESFDAVAPLVLAGRLPRCTRCAQVLKPAITFFGELLPEGALEEAFALAAAADLMLVLGSSLVVQPAASVPLVTVQNGGRLAIVNLGPTPLDRLACWRGEDLAAEFAALAAIWR